MSYDRFDVPAIAKQKKWAERLQVLQERLYDHAQYVPDQEVTIEHMFYSYTTLLRQWAIGTPKSALLSQTTINLEAEWSSIKHTLQSMFECI